MNKENLIAACGLYCGACEMYRATHDNDAVKIQKTLKALNAAGKNYTAEDITCDGCLAGGKLTVWCRDCKMKHCVKHEDDNGICSPDCGDFPCRALSSFANHLMTHHHEVIENLRRLHETSLEQHAQEEEKRWACPQCGKAMAWYERKCSACGEPRSDRLFKLEYDWPG